MAVRHPCLCFSNHLQPFISYAGHRHVQPERSVTLPAATPRALGVQSRLQNQVLQEHRLQRGLEKCAGGLGTSWPKETQALSEAARLCLCSSWSCLVVGWDGGRTPLCWWWCSTWWDEVGLAAKPGDFGQEGTLLPLLCPAHAAQNVIWHRGMHSCVCPMGNKHEAGVASAQ